MEGWLDMLKSASPSAVKQVHSQPRQLAQLANLLLSWLVLAIGA